ncbi:MAG: class I SAM-dependent methyltransferase [Egibacteraceae bacterium]
MDLDALKAQARTLWALGDYREVAGLFMPAAEVLVEALGIRSGQRILDVAAGTGNVALAAARRGAVVTASDLTPRMLELGRARAEAEGLQVEWVEADAEDLPFGDASFDVVTSAFGTMFAPRPDVVVAEAARVLRPGGVFGMANWRLEGYVGRLGSVMRRWRSRPSELPDPYAWGDEATVRARLGGLFESIECRSGCLRWAFDSPAAHRVLLERHFAPVVAARDAIGPEAAAALSDDLEALAAEYAEPGGGVDIDVAYLLVIAQRP